MLTFNSIDVETAYAEGASICQIGLFTFETVNSKTDGKPWSNRGRTGWVPAQNSSHFRSPLLMLGSSFQEKLNFAAIAAANDASYLLARIDEVTVGKVGIARRRAMAPAPEKSATERQVLTRHDGLTDRGMPKVMQRHPAEIGLCADRAPADNKAVRISAFGKFRKQKRTAATHSGQRVDLRPRGCAERHRAGRSCYRAD